MTLTASPDGSRRTTVVLGGTGMLWPLCLRLDAGGDEVHAVGHQPRPLTPEPSVICHAADWNDRSSYVALLEQLAALTPANVVAWLHSDSAIQHEEALAILKPKVYIEVVGSATIHQGDAGLLEPPMSSTCSCRQRVILGEHRGPAGRRWLTHSEISDGVFEALQQGGPVRVVGELPV